MSNMSYCRFQNTDRDLDDCKDALEEMVDGYLGLRGAPPLSREELAAAKSLVRNCANILNLLAEATGQDVERLLDRDDLIDEAVDEVNEMNA
jgi:hypothetical protein